MKFEKTQIGERNIVVNYWDDDLKKMETKKCIRMKYDSANPTDFEFMPVDNPVKIYKSVIIKHPLVQIVSNDEKLSIAVAGYRYIDGEYALTTATFTI